MDYALNISASGVLTAMYRQDVLANNLANVETIGFKPDIASTRQRAAARQEDNLPFLPSNTLLERLGAGVMLAPNRMNLTQGSLRQSSNPYDLAIQGDGYFVARRQLDGGNPQEVLTRDGRFLRNSAGLLVTTDGSPVLDDAGREIRIPAGPAVNISSNGTIRQDGKTIAKLRVIQVPWEAGLTKEGSGTILPTREAMARSVPASGEVRQFALEESGVDEVMAIMDISKAARDADANVAMIQHTDRLLDRAINVLGRVV